MLTELVLENYRGFSYHSIPLRPTTVLVGENNAGKSTIVEALRLLSLVVTRFENLQFSPGPTCLGLGLATRGVSPSLRNVEINLNTICYRYGKPPAKVTARFESEERVEIYVGPETVFAVVYDSDDRMVTTKGAAARTHLPDVKILPQVAPLAREERRLSQQYVEAARSSSLSPLHFRNQLVVFNEYFDDFRVAVESLWPGMRIRELDTPSRLSTEEPISLLVQDGDFTAEVSWMGHGLQTWLQTIWFLVLAAGADTMILDEPDVYMHADLQRKLIRYIKGRFGQIIIATHSPEIMAEVEPEDILIVNRERPQSQFATSMPIAQSVVESIGSVHNLQLARLWNGRRLLLVEGDDVPILKRFQDAIDPLSQTPIDTIPRLELKGWGGWNYVAGSSMLLSRSGGADITCFCILDSDFHTTEEINSRYENAEILNVQLHIWARKEIENYLLVPTAIHRAIEKDFAGKGNTSTVNSVTQELYVALDEFKDKVFDSLSSELKKQNKGWETGTANQKAREIMKHSWETWEGRIALAPGKLVISRMSKWAQQSFNVSLSPLKIAREVRRSELPDEIIQVIQAIEQNVRFQTTPRPYR